MNYKVNVQFQTLLYQREYPEFSSILYPQPYCRFSKHFPFTFPSLDSWENFYGLKKKQEKRRRFCRFGFKLVLNEAWNGSTSVSDFDIHPVNRFRPLQVIFQSVESKVLIKSIKPSNLIKHGRFGSTVLSFVLRCNDDGVFETQTLRTENIKTRADSFAPTAKIKFYINQNTVE